MVCKYFFTQKRTMLWPWGPLLKINNATGFLLPVISFVIIILGKTKIVWTFSARGVTNQIYIQLLTVISIQTLMDWCQTHYTNEAVHWKFQNFEKKDDHNDIFCIQFTK